MEAVPPMSDEQFNVLIDTVKSLAPTTTPEHTVKSKGSMSKCSETYDGETNVDNFITAVEAYKDIEDINDEDALKGLPLLLSGIAKLWWKGVRRETRTWEEAIQALRDNFSPTKAPYQIYMELFETKQKDGMPIDHFVCDKRALLAKLPEGLHDEATELNFIYGLMDPEYQEQIPRNEITTFRELLEKGRIVEKKSKKVRYLYR